MYRNNQRNLFTDFGNMIDALVDDVAEAIEKDDHKTAFQSYGELLIEKQSNEEMRKIRVKIRTKITDPDQLITADNDSCDKRDEIIDKAIEEAQQMLFEKNWLR